MNGKLLSILIFCYLATTATILSQELIPFAGRRTFENVRGDLTVIGNDMVGVLYRLDNSTWYDPNAAYNEDNTANGNFWSAYIDIDNDPTTFSSSSADLVVENPDCSQIAYAGLYWSANYYMARRDTQSNFTEDEIVSDTDTNVALSINNSIFAGSYSARGSEFNNDNSDIKFSPVSSYLVVAQPENGCGITNTDQLNGNIAVIRNGGNCSIREKVINAQDAGAVGVVIVNNDSGSNSPGWMPRMTGDGATINIPSISIGNDDIIANQIGGFDLITAMNGYTDNPILATLSTTGDAQLTGLPSRDPRKIGPADFRNVKFKIPGGDYEVVSAQHIIWDGYAGTATNNQTDMDGNPVANDEVQYVCYADVTNLIDPNNLFGTYTVADMKATQGYTTTGDGACGGWMLVVVYEDYNLPSKFISTQDGYVQIFPNDPAPDPINFRFDGFRTPPAPAPVNITFGVSTLEGDKRWLGDQLLLQNTEGNYVNLGFGNDVFGDVNPINNFFNSSISINGIHTTSRTPASMNTMGFDIDLLKVPNPGNLLIGNDQMSADFRLLTESDRYSVYFNAFTMASTEPAMDLINIVFDEQGTTDITGEEVELGDIIFYELQLQNTGTEDMVDGTVKITNALPDNTTLLEVAQVPDGVSITETISGTLLFNIPSELVETDRDGEGSLDPPVVIRIKVEIVASCEELKDTCSNEIKNSASVSYTGIQSNLMIVNQSSSISDSCGNISPQGTGNILVNVTPCRQDIALCNENLTLITDSGYDQYTWTGPGINTPVIQTTSSNPNANVFVVSNAQAGVYLVIKEDTNPNDGNDCMELQEEFLVQTAENLENPLNESADQILTCIATGQNYPVIFLEDSEGRDLNISISDITSIVWQQLDEINCDKDVQDSCPIEDVTCSNNWKTICQTAECTINDQGEYRVMIEFSDCSSVHYFRANVLLSNTEYHNINFQMYPNPTSGLVYIQGNTSIQKITVVDLTGKTLMQTKKRTLDIRDFDRGVYFVQIKTHKMTSLLKLIKE